MFSKKFFIICAAALVDPLIVMSINPLVPSLKTAFNVNVELVALSLTFHMIPFSFLNLFSGTLSDLYVRSKILILGLCLSSIGSLLGALSPNISLFSFSRGIQGVGSALIMPLTLALIGDTIPGEELGKAMGVYGVFLGLGTTIGPLLGGFIATIEWRLLEFLLMTYSLILVILVMKIFGTLRTSKKKGNINLVFQQLQQVAKKREVIMLSVAGFLLFFTFQGIQPFISNTLSLPPLSMRDNEIGFLFAIVGLTGIVFSLIGGFLVNKIGGRTTMIFSFLMMIPTQFFLTFVHPYWIYLLLLMFLQGFQSVAWNSVQTLLMLSSPKARGTASSIYNFTRYLGFGIAPVLLSAIYVTQGLGTLSMFNMIILFVFVLYAYLTHRVQKFQ